MNLKKLKTGLVASYDLRPGNGEGLFWFHHFINLSLTCLFTHLLTYLHPQDPHGAMKACGQFAGNLGIALGLQLYRQSAHR